MINSKTILRLIFLFISDLGLILVSGFVGALIALSGNFYGGMWFIVVMLLISVGFKVWAESLK